MSLVRAWKILNARWLTGTAAGKPATGSGAGYVPTLQADDTVIWALPGSVGHWSPMVDGSADPPELVFVYDVNGAPDVLEFWVE